MDPLPTINRVFDMVIQHERQQSQNFVSMEEHNNFANATKKMAIFSLPERIASIFMKMTNATSLMMLEKTTKWACTMVVLDIQLTSVMQNMDIHLDILVILVNPNTTIGHLV